ncbi:hypothetical protein RRG08_020568 [Elysia crispata]|uniref:Uncharacterized protein n=1 Tax=Elysia crispata TaxID=231223 RepID=A0AAE1DSW8_9GAST|nr:hypothetical protein RRG08_020568 [Elysia crispata]
MSRSEKEPNNRVTRDVEIRASHATYFNDFRFLFEALTVWRAPQLVRKERFLIRRRFDRGVYQAILALPQNGNLSGLHQRGLVVAAIDSKQSEELRFCRSVGGCGTKKSNSFNKFCRDYLPRVQNFSWVGQLGLTILALPLFVKALLADQEKSLSYFHVDRLYHAINHRIKREDMKSKEETLAAKRRGHFLRKERECQDRDEGSSSFLLEDIRRRKKCSTKNPRRRLWTSLSVLTSRHSPRRAVWQMSGQRAAGR